MQAAVPKMYDNSQQFTFGSGSAHGDYRQQPTNNTNESPTNDAENSVRKHARSSSSIEPPSSIVKKKSRVGLTHDYQANDNDTGSEYTAVSKDQQPVESPSPTAAPHQSPSQSQQQQQQSLHNDQRPDDFVAVINTNGQVLHTSSTVQNYLGYHPTGLQHRLIVDFVHQNERERYVYYYSREKK